VFRPIGPVEMPEGTRVVVEAEETAEARIVAARRRVFETMSRSYDTNEPGDVLGAHDDHQP
jgi:predicted DNA-binding antitoxin AbrB/MazE fold protein